MWFVLATVLFTGLVGNVVSQNCLAAVGTKEYCYDVSALRTWTDAQLFCEQSGMALATIRIRPETDFLRGANDPDTFYGEFWVAARDIQEHPQFVWSLSGGTRETLDVRHNAFVTTAEPLAYQTCLVYESVAGDASGLKMAPCTSTFPTLCERVSGTLNGSEHENHNKTYFY